MCTEKEKCRKGMLYDANNDVQLLNERQQCKDLCHEYNALPPSCMRQRLSLITRILGSVGTNFSIEQPFFCDYGYNVHIGDNFFSNFNCVMLDEANITIGDNVFIGPNCGFYTASHPMDVALRNKGLETAHSINIGSNVWIGGGVTVLPGVNIGDNCVIGAGSVVTHDIPANAVAYGNPCKVAKTLGEQQDANK